MAPKLHRDVRAVTPTPSKAKPDKMSSEKEDRLLAFINQQQQHQDNQDSIAKGNSRFVRDFRNQISGFPIRNELQIGTPIQDQSFVF